MKKEEHVFCYWSIKLFLNKKRPFSYYGHCQIQFVWLKYQKAKIYCRLINSGYVVSYLHNLALAIIGYPWVITFVAGKPIKLQYHKLSLRY